jgi:hypothetical protein
MEIKSVLLGGNHEESSADASTQIFMLEVSGVMDQDNARIRRARELIGRAGSSAMLASFDNAIKAQKVAE